MTPMEKKDLESIVRVIAQCSKVESAILFGSRAKGNHRESSDWDIALKGPELSISDVLSIQVQMDDLWLPTAVDILIYDSIQNPALLDHIDRVGVLVWSRNPALADFKEIPENA